jgi:hypothetical protein
MVITISGSWVGGVKKGDPAFLIGTGFYGPFQIGMKSGADHWLQGLIVGHAEFLFNGRLFLPNRGQGTVIDNFPKGPVQSGWTVHRRPDIDGYELVGPGEKVIFGYAVKGKICRVTVNLYSADGRLIAESLPNEFKIHTNQFWAGPDAVDRAP